MTVEKASDRLGRMTFRDMAIARGMISLIATFLGTKNANRGREMVKSVSHVMKKWKAANVNCASFKEGSEKMALFVKTCSCRLEIVHAHDQRYCSLRKHTMPIVANVFTTIHITAVLVEVSGFGAGAGFSPSSCSDRSSARSISSPMSISSGVFSLPSLIFSLSSYGSAAVTEELADTMRSVAIVAGRTGIEASAGKYRVK